jgi:hypothetical protein
MKPLVALRVTLIRCSVHFSEREEYVMGPSMSVCLPHFLQNVAEVSIVGIRCCATVVCNNDLVMWREEHLLNVSVLQRLNVSNFATIHATFLTTKILYSKMFLATRRAVYKTHKCPSNFVSRCFHMNSDSIYEYISFSSRCSPFCNVSEPRIMQPPFFVSQLLIASALFLLHYISYRKGIVPFTSLL